MGETRCHVGALVDRDFEVADRIIVVLQDFNDLFLISFAERFIVNNGASVMLADPNRLVKSNMIFSMAFEKISGQNPDRIRLFESHSLDADLLRPFDLLLISTSGWKDVDRPTNQWIRHAPSMLILKPQGDQEREGMIKPL